MTLILPTQIALLRTIRRPMPRPATVIVDKRAKGRRKRVKKVEIDASSP